MSTQEIADKLVALCRSGKNDEAVKTLFADHAVSMEMAGVPNGRVEGKANILKKSEEWFKDVEEIHRMEVSEPVVGGGCFSCAMTIDVTSKSRGRNKESEVCLYQVSNGKIVSEQFFYEMPQEAQA